jgi:hypothetical protein
MLALYPLVLGKLEQIAVLGQHVVLRATLGRYLYSPLVRRGVPGFASGLLHNGWSEL